MGLQTGGCWFPKQSPLQLRQREYLSERRTYLDIDILVKAVHLIEQLHENALHLPACMHQLSHA